MLLLRVQILEDEVRAKLKDFYADNSSKSLKLPPMDKCDRSIVHDVVACEFPELQSDSVGDGEDRSAIIYRKVMSFLETFCNFYNCFIHVS